MIEHKELIAIFTQLSNNKKIKDHFDNSYFLLYTFNDQGIIEKELLKDLYEETIKASDFGDSKLDYPESFIGPFISFESLQNFCYKLCVDLKSPQITLNSIDEYNICAENAQDNDGLINSLKQNEKTLKNVELSDTKGILGKLFS